MAIQIQLRRGTTTEWFNSNPLLAQGEIGVDLTTGKFKIGDGLLHWNSLNYGTTLAGIDDISDVLATDPLNGSVLVYDSGINKWVATTTLNQQNMDAGEF
jgi:hypothetical protein